MRFSRLPFSRAGIDQRQGALLATQRQLGRGHRQIGFIGGPEHCSDSVARQSGFLETIPQAGLARAGFEESGWSAAGGYEALHRLLDRSSGCSALFVANDQMALGVLRAARVRGLRVPQDLSIVGFDNLPESEYFEPPLTTVHQDFRALGEGGMALLLARLQSQKHCG